MTGRSSETAAPCMDEAGPDEAALPFQDAAKEQSDLRFIRRFRPKGPPPERARPVSALSTPANFIAEGPLRRAMRRLLGHGARPPVTAGLAVLVALAAIPAGLRLAAAPETAEHVAEPSPARAEADAPAPAGADTIEARPATRSLAIEPAVANESPPPPQGEERPRSFADLADAGPELPSALFAFASPAPRVTAFPPMLPAGAAPAAVKPAEAIEPARAAASPEQDRRILDALVERGTRLLSQGEIAGARLFFERVVARDDPRGALGLARSHDPLVLKGLFVVGLTGSEAEAERWYRKARELGGGSAEANAERAER